MAKLTAHNELCKYDDDLVKKLHHFMWKFCSPFFAVSITFSTPSYSSRSVWHCAVLTLTYIYFIHLEFSLCLQLPYAYCSLSAPQHNYPLLLHRHIKLKKKNPTYSQSYTTAAAYRTYDSNILCHIRWMLRVPNQSGPSPQYFIPSLYTRHTHTEN